MLHDDVLWVEKYRPHKIDDTILPNTLKATFKEMVSKGVISNMTFAGGPGIGKTTVARALCDELDTDYMIINGSLHGNIDTLRTQIKDFASSVSFSGKRKMVILDEADYLTPLTQPALRNFIEEYSKNCGFILTCNYPNKIIDAIKSRAPVTTFAIEKKDLPAIAGQFMARCQEILKAENVEYDPKVVAELIKKNLPDWRKTINELQTYSVTGKIDTGILANVSDENFMKFVSLVKKKDFTGVRRWIGENTDVEHHVLFKKFYDLAYDMVVPQSIPMLILILNKYDYQAAFVIDKEINLTAAAVEIMSEVEFK